MRTLARITFVGSVAALLCGCANNDPVSFSSIRSDLTPELAGLADRPEDIDRHTAVMMNQNSRSFWDDFNRALFIDHPSRLSPYPLIDTSGNPR